MGKVTIVCLFLVAGIAAVETAGQYWRSQQPHMPCTPQWDKYGVFAKRTIFAGDEITPDAVNERLLKPGEVAGGNVKTVCSACLRKAKRTIHTYEMIMYEDLGAQLYVPNYPHPENEVE